MTWSTLLVTIIALGVLTQIHDAHTYDGEERTDVGTDALGPDRDFDGPFPVGVGAPPSAVDVVDPAVEADGASADLTADDVKRKWGENKARMWGKRDAEKRPKWGGQSSRVWGKRRLVEEVKNFGRKPNADEGYKRNRWADNKARVWGKRDA